MLFVVWEENGEIPDIDAPPSAANTKNAAAQVKMESVLRKRLMQCLRDVNPNPSEEEIRRVNMAKMDRSLRAHYAAILQFSVAVRILSTRSISPNEIRRGKAALSRAMQAFATMNCHLTPYCHLIMHIPDQLYEYGPCYSNWAWPYERNNGFLGRTNTNRHCSGELECTMMRRWWRVFFAHDLISFCFISFTHRLILLYISYLQALPRTVQDDDSVALLESCLKGGTDQRHGAYMNFLNKVYSNDGKYIHFSSHDRLLPISAEHIVFPVQCTTIRLRSISHDMYNLVFHHICNVWRMDERIHTDVSFQANSVPFTGEVTSYPYLSWSHIRYGAANSHRGKSAQYAYIEGRTAVQIEYLFHVRQKRRNEDRDPLATTVAIVRRFQRNGNIPDFPWDAW